MQLDPSRSPHTTTLSRPTRRREEGSRVDRSSLSTIRNHDSRWRTCTCIWTPRETLCSDCCHYTTLHQSLLHILLLLTPCSVAKLNHNQKPATPAAKTVSFGHLLPIRTRASRQQAAAKERSRICPPLQYFDRSNEWCCRACRAGLHR